MKEALDCATAEIGEYIEEYCKENKPTLCPDWGDLDCDGRLHEIIDSCVPIYNWEIRDAWYLYANELEEAYENAGVGDNPRENNGMAAIYFYLWEKSAEWAEENLETIFEEWEENNGSEE